jgi:hypothetical protein
VGAKGERGAATVEHAALGLLIAIIAAAGIAAVASGPLDGGRELGSTLGRKLRCAARGPGPCWRDPLTEAYGRPLAGAVRALAPPPATRPGPGGTVFYPVDFRYCRSPSCALPGPGSPALTASNRRTTAFVAVTDRRRSAGVAEIDYWLYRPTRGWERTSREVTSAEVARLAATPLLETDVPALVPLETLPGANHFDFPPGEEPPWRWQIERR